jgi:predicted metalloprotease with PDZ domain
MITQNDVEKFTKIRDDILIDEDNNSSLEQFFDELFKRENVRDEESQNKLYSIVTYKVAINDLYEATKRLIKAKVDPLTV